MEYRSQKIAYWYFADGHSTIALDLVTAHGRATPWVWMTVTKARLKGRRNRYEDTVLLRLHEVLPPRGGGHDPGRPWVWRSEPVCAPHRPGLRLHHPLSRGGLVQSRDGGLRPAHEWVPPNGRTRQLKDARAPFLVVSLMLVCAGAAMAASHGKVSWLPFTLVALAWRAATRRPKPLARPSALDSTAAGVIIGE